MPWKNYFLSLARGSEPQAGEGWKARAQPCFRPLAALTWAGPWPPFRLVLGRESTTATQRPLQHFTSERHEKIWALTPLYLQQARQKVWMQLQGKEKLTSAGEVTMNRSSRGRVPRAK